jgi:hypothetical protein
MSNLYLFPKNDVNNWYVRASNIFSNYNTNLTLDASGNSNLILRTNGTTRINLDGAGNIDISGNTTFINALPTCSIVPTSGSQLVNKTYVDGAAGGFSTWTAFTPTTTQGSGSYTGIGAATIGCYYLKSGKLVFVRYNIVYDSNFGQSGQPIGISLPFTPATNAISPDTSTYIQGCCGSATWYSLYPLITASAQQFSLSACIAKKSNVASLYLYGGNAPFGIAYWGQNPEFQCGFYHEFSAFITYETSL